jgi:heat shock protein HslJ
MKWMALCIVCCFSVVAGCSSNKPSSGLPPVNDSIPAGPSVEHPADSTRNCQMNPEETRQLFLKGTDFFAFGNDPSWTLEMDMDNAFRFSVRDGYVINTPPVKGHKAMDADVEFFHATTESAEIRITITGETRNKEGPGSHSDYTVRIEAKYSSEKDFQTFEGCGFYIYDYRLHDIWVMKSMSGVNLNAEKLMKGLPVFEFYPSDQRVSGHTGCNNFNSRLQVRGDQLTFGHIILTKMSCPDMDAEKAIINGIQQKTFRYRIEEGNLTLQNAEGSSIAFRKID